VSLCKALGGSLGDRVVPFGRPKHATSDEGIYLGGGWVLNDPERAHINIFKVPDRQHHSKVANMGQICVTSGSLGSQWLMSGGFDGK
jgi:hypothetical protein